MVIPKGFPKSVGRVGSRLHGFPCFPHSVISMALFLRSPNSVAAVAPLRTGSCCHPDLREASYLSEAQLRYVELANLNVSEVDPE